MANMYQMVHIKLSSSIHQVGPLHNLEIDGHKKLNTRKIYNRQDWATHKHFKIKPI